MQNLPILLSAQRGNWQRFKARRRNKRYLAFQKKIYLRDKFTCRYCGFQSKKYIYTVNHDQNYSNNKAKNIMTSCSLCMQNFFLESIGQDPHTGGDIIFLPEVSQADVNHFCRVLFSSMLRDAPYRGKLHTTYLSFKDRTKIVDEIFGPDSHTPSIFGQALIDSKISAEQSQNSILQHLRFLPDRKVLTEQILYWKKTVFDQIPL